MDYEKDFIDETARTSMGNIHFRHHAGNGPHVIFLHGLGATVLVWKRLVEYLPKEWDIYLVDLLGHGQSDAPTDIKYTVSNQYQALNEFIALQNIGSPFLFGNSYGAWVAAYFAAQPTGCKGIILEDCSGIKEYFDEIESKGQEYVEEYRRNLLNKTMMMSGNREYVMKGIIYADAREDQLDEKLLQDIKRPTMVLWGSNDTTIDVKYASVLSQKIKGSKMYIIEGVGHEPHFSRGEDVAKLLIDFVRKNQ